jgi:hypothetical protein
MELIRVRADRGAVTLRVEIEGLVAWHYHYQADGAAFVGKSTLPAPRVHPLGSPQQLNADVNSWDLHLFNPASEATAYSVTLTWTQGGGIIHEWGHDATLGPEGLVPLKGDAFFIVG